MAGMVPEDVYELTWAADPRLSPDGRTVAYCVFRLDREDNEYRSTIWTCPVDGSLPPRQFTAGPKVDAEARWSPDGTALAFVSNRERDAKQLYVIPAAGGEPRRLTDLKEDVTEIRWSPDGGRIAFSARVRAPEYEEDDDKKRAPRRFTRLQYKLDNVGWTGDRRRHLFVVPADGSSEPMQLTDGDFEDSAPTWSPDGARIAFGSNREDDWDVTPHEYLYVVDASGGEPRRITPDDSAYGYPVWSQDASLIACYWQRGGWDYPQHNQVAVVDPETGERRVLTESLDRQCAPYPLVREVAWDGESILFVLEEHGNQHVYRVRADGSAPPEPLTQGDLTVTGFDVVGGTLVDARSTPTAPAELYAGQRRLTEVTKPFVGGRELVEPERFTAVSEDGSEVEAWILRPVGLEAGTRYPVLLNIHGGPFSQYANRFFDEFQVYAGAGYAVVYSNPRGSSGYSEEWGRAIRGPIDEGPGWGTVDYQDLMAVTNEALSRFDFCDPERLGVMGGSYGGYMTSWIVAHTDRFRAACSERAVNNLYSEFGSSDIGWVFKAWTGAHAFEDPATHLRHSPVTYAEDITTPLLILHSESDLRCHPEQAEQLFSILRLSGRDVEFVRFPDEGHELSRSGSPAHRVMRFDVVLDWFARKL
jgi:dipeptidyl aminopeptidase/acylaminoacyl peptidase